MITFREVVIDEIDNRLIPNANLVSITLESRVSIRVKDGDQEEETLNPFSIKMST